MTATDAQVRIIMRERQQGKTQEQAAAKANLRSRKTVAKHEQLGVLPSALQQPRPYRTQKNPLTDDWETVTVNRTYAIVAQSSNCTMLLTTTKIGR